MYFSNTQKVEIVRDLEFGDCYENDDSLKTCLQDGILSFFPIMKQVDIKVFDTPST